MTLEPIRQCDIFGVRKDVKPITIEMRSGDDVLFTTTIDMGSRAIERAKGLLEKATTKPGPKEESSCPTPAKK